MSAQTHLKCVHLKSHANGEVEPLSCHQTHSAKALCEGHLTYFCNLLNIEISSQLLILLEQM